MSRCSLRTNLGALAACAFLTGCHSAFVQATVVNHSGKAVHLFEVDYPSASFGGSELPDGAIFRYRFKILGSGQAKILWTDAAEQEHSGSGPDLREGEEGVLTITLGAGSATWDANLHSTK